MVKVRLHSILWSCRFPAICYPAADVRKENRRPPDVWLPHSVHFSSNWQRHWT